MRWIFNGNVLANIEPPSHSGIATGLRPVPFGPPGSIPGGGVYL